MEKRATGAIRVVNAKRATGFMPVVHQAEPGAAFADPMTQSTPNPQLEPIAEADVTQATDEAIRRLLCACFPKDTQAFARSRAWHDSAPAYSLVCRQGGSIVGHVGVVVRQIRCGQTAVMVAGVQSLAVARRRRGTGLSQRLMTAAMDQAGRRGIEFGLLFCVPGLEPLYRSLGWVKTDRPATMADQAGRIVPLPETNVTLFKELSGRPFPPGPIDLQGRDW